MAKSANSVLDSIPGLVKKGDAAGLVALEDHEDKKIRKAARKGIHQLRSRGVEIPEKGARSWSTGDSLQQMRGDLESAAVIDVASMPGATRIVWSAPDEEEGGTLLIGTLGPDGRMLDFNAYMQTDGQRQRMIRDWDRQYESRRVPADWARSRLRWARERTLALGYNVPPQLDDALPRLGDASEERPASFLVKELEGAEASESSTEDVLVAAGCHRWPLLFEADDMFRRLSESASAGEPEKATDEEKLAEVAAAMQGDENLREALHGPFANALEDAAAGVWLEGKTAEAATLLGYSQALRAEEKAEALDWVAVLVRFQIAAVAMQQLLQQQQGHHHHDHDHDHDHDHHHHGHDHDHDHDHA